MDFPFKFASKRPNVGTCESMFRHVDQNVAIVHVIFR